MQKPLKYIRLENDRQTSLRMEPELWEALKALAMSEGLTLTHLIRKIENERHSEADRTSAIRVYIVSNLLAFFKARKPKKRKIS